jgi:hypothetical protein
MSSLGGDGSNWLSDLAAAVVPQKTPENDGDCMGLSGAGLMGVSCDMVSNFACQAPSPPNYSPPPAMRFHCFKFKIQHFNSIFLAKYSTLYYQQQKVSRYNFLLELH